MGLFSKTQPQVLTAEQGAAQAGQYLTQALDPLVESYGYQSQENQVLDIMKGVDIEDIDSFNAAYKKILGINPEAAAEFKSQVMPMMKTTLEMRGLKNKPVLAAEWRLDVGKKFTARYASDFLPGQPQGLETRSDIVNYLNKLVTAGTIKNTVKNDWLKDYDKSMKAGRDNYILTNKGRTGKGTTEGTISSKDVFGGYDAKVKVDKIDPNEDVATTGAGYEGTSDVTQVDPKSSGFMRGAQNLQADAEVRGKVTQLANLISPAIFGSLTLSLEEEKLNDRRKPAYDWFTTKGREYFINNPGDLEDASKGPLAWYEANIAKKTK